jgi:Protein of unknown function (DUF3800)
MLIFYIDESGDTGMAPPPPGVPGVLKPGVSHWFVLAAVGISETSRIDLAEDIMYLKDKYFRGWKGRNWGDSEIKGSYLRAAHRRLSHGRRPAKPSGYNRLKKDRLDELCAHLAALFQKFRPVIYTVAVDKVTLMQRPKLKGRPPEGIAYVFLQQRLALLVDHVFGDAEGMLMVADEQVSHERLFRTGAMLRLRTELTRPLRVQPRYELILDRPIWIDPNLHPLDREILQLPDLVAHAAYTFVSSWATPSEPFHMWPEISACLAAHWATRRVADGGFAIYPRPKAYPKGI